MDNESISLDAPQSRKSTLIWLGFIGLISTLLGCGSAQYSVSMLPTKFVNAGGVQTHYATQGSGEAIVLLHGYPENLQEWYQVMPSLATNYAVYALDLKGMGKTEAPEGSYAQRDMARHVVDFMEAQQIAKAHIVGFDIGLGVALGLAAYYPERVNKLIVGDGNLYVDNMPVGFEMKALRKWPWGEILVYQPTRIGFWYTYARGGGMPADPIFEDIVSDGSRNSFKKRGLQIFRDYAAHARELVAALPTIKAPSLVFWATDDPWFPIEHGNRMHADLAGSEFKVFSGNKHFVMHENPHEFTEMIRTFLQSPPRKTL